MSITANRTMILRKLLSLLRKRSNQGKALILLGARQIGKTTLVKMLSKDYPDGEVLYFNCDEKYQRSIFTDTSVKRLEQVIGSAKLLIIDEAQRIENAGLSLKLITDNFPDVQLVVTGSSSLELRSEINEPLTGRKFEYQMFPLSYTELVDHFGYAEAMGQLEQRLIFGMYPEIVTKPEQAELLLRNLSESYLYKDLFSLGVIRKPDLLEKLVQALAWQIGNEVSFNELSKILQVSVSTVINYIDLLEKAYVVFRLKPYRKNLRTEISSSRKIYFYDTGIRNAVIDNFKLLDFRPDAGALWENFIIVERMKVNSYAERFRRNYFWRTRGQQEIDYVEDTGGKLYAYEIKWNPKSKVKFPKKFLEAYPESETLNVTPENMMDFLAMP